MNIGSKMNNASLLSLFMFTVQEYDAITACVPLPAKIECSSISDPLGLRCSKIEEIEKAWTAICVRMMLQRKYFSNGERVQLKKLFDIAETDSRFNTKTVGDLRKRLKQPLGRDIELMNKTETMYKGILVTSKTSFTVACCTQIMIGQCGCRRFPTMQDCMLLHHL